MRGSFSTKMQKPDVEHIDGHIKSAASDMANVIRAKMNGVEQARFDYSKLTPEQRERYASYRAKAPS